jgi:hypothetical protein
MGPEGPDVCGFNPKQLCWRVFVNCSPDKSGAWNTPDFRADLAFQTDRSRMRAYGHEESFLANVLLFNMARGVG